jgi:hypothetical protein
LVLHNFIERDGDHWNEKLDVCENRHESEAEMEHASSRNLAKAEGERKRMELMKIVLQNHDYNIM